MTTTDRIAPHGAKLDSTSQQQNQSKAELAFNAARASMVNIGQAAGAALIMMAERIRSNSEAHAGWETLSVQGFGDGTIVLATDTINGFWQALKEFPNEPTQLENAVGGLRFCVVMLADVLADRGDTYSFETGYRLSKQLDAAFHQLWEAKNALR